MKSATERLIELAEWLTPSGEIADGTVAEFHALAARARIEQFRAAIVNPRVEIAEKTVAGGFAILGDAARASAPVRLRCPKCRYWSGDSWGQCGGSCPVRMSPDYAPDAEREYGPLAPEASDGSWR